jgi:hypothetical protein
LRHTCAAFAPVLLPARARGRRRYGRHCTAHQRSIAHSATVRSVHCAKRMQFGWARQLMCARAEGHGSKRTPAHFAESCATCSLSASRCFESTCASPGADVVRSGPSPSAAVAGVSPVAPRAASSAFSSEPRPARGAHRRS